MKFFKISFIVSFIFLTFIFPQVASGQNSESTLSAKFLKIDNPSNHFDRFIEKIVLFTKFSQESKADYMMSLLDKRLADLYIVVVNDKGNLIEEISSRYASYTGSLGDFFNENELGEKERKLSQKFKNHIEILTEIQKRYKNDSPFRMLLQHDINTINIIQEKF